MTEPRALQTTQSPPAGSPFTWRFTTPLLVGSTFNPINSSIIATALTPIARTFDVSAGRATILVAALYVASGIAQPTMGKLAARFGGRRVFLAGIILVLAGGILGTIGTSLATLTVARVILGIGTSAGYPCAMHLIRGRAADTGIDAPGSVLGQLTLAAQVTAAFGLPLGGLLVGAAGWRVTFAINIPLALIAAAMAWRWIPSDAPSEARPSLRSIASDVDPAGILLFGGAFSSLLIFLMGLRAPNWITLGLAVVLFAVLIAWERRAAAPLIDVRMLAANRPLCLTYLRTVVSLFGGYCVMYGVTQWLQDGKGLSALITGLVMLPMSAVAIFVSGPVSRRNLIRSPLLASAIIALAVGIGLRLMDVHTPVVLILMATIAFGVSFTLGPLGLQASMYDQTPAPQIGPAAGLLRTFTYTGAVFSSSLISLVYSPTVSTDGLHTLGNLLALTSLLSVVLVVADRRLPRRISQAGSSDATEPVVR
ncbi:MFS transporter [Nocardia jiangxiensis]|uniref:MFS transporter n=1 Tax=Nocardia jiangxiensis TaxID=282685 RepID=A0ABW6SCI2_9NOCA|nr:MFS transporter [Nocardia jiangxiensis]